MTNNEAIEAAIELMPCPFCGGKAEIERIGTGRVSTIYSCQQCGCRLETGEQHSHGLRWNSRQNAGAVDVSDMVDKIKYHMMTERGKVSDEEVSGVCCAINYLSRRGLLKSQEGGCRGDPNRNGCDHCEPEHGCKPALSQQQGKK